MIDNNKNYDDIINLEHHVSKTRKPMSLYDRAAQFAPFAALTGYNEEIMETARITEGKLILDDSVKEDLSLKLQIIEMRMKDRINLTIIYFVPDEKKNGGKYKEINGVIKKIDNIEKTITLEDLTKISMNNIIEIKSEVFNILQY